MLHPYIEQEIRKLSESEYLLEEYIQAQLNNWNELFIVYDIKLENQPSKFEEMMENQAMLELKKDLENSYLNHVFGK